MQNPEIAERASNSAYRAKDYVLPSGNVIKVQGFEPYALNEIFKTYSENDIIIGCKNVPIINYITPDGKKHIHFVDIWIPSQNLMIEVKSTWTFSKKPETIILKKEAAIAAGYNYQIWVYDKKGIKIPDYENQWLVAKAESDSDSTSDNALSVV